MWTGVSVSISVLVALAGCAVGQSTDLVDSFAPGWHQQAAKAKGVELSFGVEGKTVRVTVRDRRVQAWVDGKLVSAAHLRGSLPTPITLNGKKLATIRGIAAGSPVVMTQTRAELGVNVGAIGSALAQHLEINSKEAVIVLSVHKGKSAEKAGLKKHDIILEIDGDTPVTRSILTKRVKAKKPGATIKLRILRRGEPRDVSAKLGKGHSPTLSYFYDFAKTTQPYTLDVTYPRAQFQGNRLFVSPGVSGFSLPAATKQSVDKQIEKLRKDLKRIMERLEKLSKERGGDK